MYPSGKSYKAISKVLGHHGQSHYPQMEKTCNSGKPSQEWPAYQNDSKSATTTHPGGHKNPLQAPLASINISVHDSTIRKRLGKNGIHGRAPRQKPLLTKNNTKARLTFAKKYLIPKDFWANILWTDETKVELFGRCVSRYIWHKTQDFIKRTSYQQSNMVVVV